MSGMLGLDIPEKTLYDRDNDSTHPNTVEFDPEDAIRELRKEFQKTFAEHDKNISRLTERNLEMLLTDMHEIAKEFTVFREKLKRIATHEQLLHVNQTLSKRGVMPAIEEFKELHSNYSLYSKEGAALCSTLANCMSRLQEHLRNGDR
jgi:GTPase involved in cell partitioning and DNA repair